MAIKGNTEQKQIIVSIKGDNSGLNEAISESQSKLDNLGGTNVKSQSVKEFKEEVKSLAQELGEAEDKAYALQKAGKFNTAEYREAIQQVAKLHNEQEKLDAAVQAFNPANKLNSFVGIANGAAVAVQGYAGAMQFLGVNSDTALESIAKLQGLMAFTDALSGIDNLKNSFRGLGLLIKGMIPSMEGANIGIKAIGLSLKAIGIGLITAAIAYLIENWDSLKKTVLDFIPDLKGMGETFNKLKAILLGVGNAVINYVVTPVKAVIDLLHGDFKKAMNDFKQGVDVVGNFKKGYQQEELNQQKKHDQQLAEEQVKSLEYQLKLAKQGSQEFIALQNQLADVKIKSAKTDDERNQAVQDKAILYAQRRYQEEDKAAQAAQQAHQKYLQQQQQIAQREKQINDEIKAAWDKYVEDRKTAQDGILTYIDEEGKAHKTEVQNAIDAEDKKYQTLLASAEKYNLDAEQLEQTHQQALADIKEKAAQANLVKGLGTVSDKAQANLISTQTGNVESENDSPDEAKQKILNITSAQIEAENAAFELKKAQAVSQNQDLEALEAQHQATLVGIQKDAANKTKQIDEATVQAKIDTYSAIGDALGSLGKLAGEQTVAGKALGVAEALINTYVGATKALAQGGVAGIASAVAVVASGLAAVKQILAVKVDAPGGSSAVSANTTAPRIDLSNVSAPTVAAANNQVNEVQDVRVINQQEQPPIKAYITDKDLKKNDNRNKFISNLSTL